MFEDSAARAGIIIASMDKRYMYHLWTKVRPIKLWYFLLAALVFGSISVWALRENNFHMAALRTAVLQADTNNTNVELALQNLQMYVTRHMNTDLSTGPNAPYPPIQLASTYDRAIRTVGEQATAANSKIYTDAQHYCEQQNSKDYYGTNRVPCVQKYVHDHSVATMPTVSDSLYKFDFASPWWSPDLAGWSLLITSTSLLAFIALIIIRQWLKSSSK
jgi:hypothetical protein